MSRNEMIVLLIKHSLAQALTEANGAWVRQIFEQGFVGFGNMKTEQLEREMHLRGLMELHDYEDEYEETDDVELMIMLSGMVADQSFRVM